MRSYYDEQANSEIVRFLSKQEYLIRSPSFVFKLRDANLRMCVVYEKVFFYKEEIAEKRYVNLDEFISLLPSSIRIKVMLEIDMYKKYAGDT